MNLTGNFKECGLRLVEKEKEWIEYRVLFGSVTEKEDWIAKMKVLKVEFQGSGTRPPSCLCDQAGLTHLILLLLCRGLWRCQGNLARRCQRAGVGEEVPSGGRHTN
jgi:hypothetical protein